MKILAVALAPVLALLAFLLTVVVVMAEDPPPAAVATVCLPRLPGAVTDVDLTAEQWRSARAIVTAGRSARVPPRGWVIAVATALQESTLRSLPYGDLDSIGLFQQRTPWGTTAARLDVAESATMFFTGGRGGQPGLLDITGWQSMPLTQAAQAVQRSAFPDAYARWEPLAKQIVAKLGGSDSDCGSPSRWVSPVRSSASWITATFGQCGPYWSACHTGLDFAAPTGTPATAAASGAVVFSGFAGAYGNVVKVLHAEGVATWYAHLDRRLVTAGARVAAGDVIGLVGQTGNSTGPHLHFEVRMNASAQQPGTATDPHDWLRQHKALATTG